MGGTTVQQIFGSKHPKMKICKLTKASVEAAPYQVWSAVVKLLFQEPYEDLAPEQRPAQLALKYDGEVQNGGHLQYFENGRGAHLDEAIAALGILGAVEQQKILHEAMVRWRSDSHPRITTSKEFCEIALEGEFSDLDSRYYRCIPTLTQCLEAHLEQNQATYVLIE